MALPNPVRAAGPLLLATALACAHAPATHPDPPRLVKELLLEAPGLVTVTGFAWVETADGPRLVVAGQRGAQIRATAWALEHAVEFPMERGVLSSPWHVEPFDVDGDGVLEFVNRGGNWHRTGVFAASGDILWTTEPEVAPNSMAVGDLEGDGAVDFVIGLNGDGGVRRLDAAGRVVWTQPDTNVWRVELIDADGDGLLEILHTNVDGAFVLRDRDGGVLQRFGIGSYAHEFAVLRDSRVLHHSGDHFLEFDARGEVRELPAAVGGVFSDMSAREVALRGLSGPAMVVLESNRADPLSVLHVFTDDGTLLHEELLEEACAGLGSEPSPDGSEALLLGCGERVWRYRAARSEADVGEPVASAAALLRPGDAVGPLRFGDPEPLAGRRLRLLPGANCLDLDCGRVEFPIEDASVVLMTDFGDEGLAALLGIARPSAKADDPEAIRANWETLVAWARREFGAPDPTPVELPPLADLAETVETHTWETEDRRVVVGIRVSERDDARPRKIALVLIAPGKPSAPDPSPAAPSR
ncbi:MAG: VCBS repeat-containing protein [Myxococcota bacterium]|nr:VCBS repeat-containing protein [Myxococcota bacterium]